MKARDALIGFTLTIVSLAGCGGGNVNAPDWVLALADREAARFDEDSPKIDFAACGPSTCTVRMFGSFREDADSRAPRLDLEVNIRTRQVQERVFNYNA